MNAASSSTYSHGLEKVAKAGPHRPARPLKIKSAQSVTGYVSDHTYKSTGESKPKFTLEDTADRYPGLTSDEHYHNILVGGANAAGKGFYGLSYLPFGVLAKGKNRELFRHNQKEEIKKAITKALLSGKTPRVVGHSWGGAAVAGMADEFPAVQFHALDPVSWTGRLKEIPENLTIYRPSEFSQKHERDFTDLTQTLKYLATRIGGRWPKIEKGPGRTVEYLGDHVNGLDEVCNDINMEQRARRHQYALDNALRGGATPTVRQLFDRPL